MNEKEKVRKRYDRWSRVYDAFDLGGVTYEKRFAADALGLKGTEKVLDFGTGTGAILPYVAGKLKTGKVYAVDFSEKMLERARTRVRKTGIQDRVEILRDDCENLSFPSDFFDCAIATFAFTSLPHPQKGAMELARVLKPSGRFAVLETGKPKKWYLLPYYWLIKPVARVFGYTYIDRNVPEYLVNAGLEILAIYRFGLTYCIKGRKREVEKH
ncbi:MAG: class I SAM-dependent methyltransferase [Thermoplasmata archaeon]|nr:class I SAM-dependent methyltransferase [Thermoplasmata archaeon]